MKKLLVVSAIAILAGCVDAELADSPSGLTESGPADPTAPGVEQGAPRAVPDVITDREGKKWKKVRKAIFRDPTPEQDAKEFAALAARSPAEDLDTKLTSMTLEEAAAYLRPRALVADHEYLMDDDGAREFAREVLNNIRSGVRPVLDGSGPPKTDKVIINGYGNWTQQNSQAANWPHHMIATMDQFGVCTAFKVANDFTAMTSGHCFVNTDGTLKTPKRIRFGAGSANTSEGGTGQAQGYLQGGSGTQCYAYRIPGCFPANANCDYAVIALRNFGGAWCNHADYDVGWFGADGASGSNITTRTGSYPGSARPSGTYPSYWYQENSGSWGGTTGDGFIYHRNDTVDGSSGAPVYDEFIRMRGVHRGHRPNTTDWNRAVQFNSTMHSFIIANGGW